MPLESAAPSGIICEPFLAVRVNGNATSAITSSSFQAQISPLESLDFPRSDSPRPRLSRADVGYVGGPLF